MVKILVRLALILFVSIAASCSNWAWPRAFRSSTQERLPEREVYAKGLIRSEQGVLDDLVDATRYQIELNVVDDVSLQGREQARYTNREDVSLEEIYLRLIPNSAGGQLGVSNVMVNGQAAEAASAAQNTALRIPLAAPLTPGQSVTITLDFTLTLPREAGGNYGLLGYLEDTFLLDEFYPVIPTHDQEGWHAAPPPPNADASYNDASYYLVRVTAPQELILVASGVEVERQQSENNQVATFAAGPARDFYLAAGHVYQVHLSDKIGEVMVNSYALSGQEEGAKEALRVATKAIGIYNKEIGSYPYTEFDVINSPLVGALGIEYPGVVSISRSAYDGSGADTQTYLESTVAHEVAHQWFYNVVGNDQPGQPWLDEAMAQYLTMIYYREAYGEAAASGVRNSWDGRWERVGRDEKPIGLPAGQYTGREYGAIVYGRGPLFLETLAEKMGQSTWNSFLRDYYQSYKWNIATTEDFRQLAEKHCQCDLTPLFQAWVYANP